jgi:hypothetical protein
MSNDGSDKRRSFFKQFHSSIFRRNSERRLSRRVSEKEKTNLINDHEIMVIDPLTGGQKGSKGSQIGFVDPVALYELGKVAGMGIVKYEKYNYLKGYDWSLSYNALMRHMQQMWAGEDFDDESGILHSVHAAWHALALASFQIRELGTDDRFKEQK